MRYKYVNGVYVLRVTKYIHVWNETFRQCVAEMWTTPEPYRDLTYPHYSSLWNEYDTLRDNAVRMPKEATIDLNLTVENAVIEVRRVQAQEFKRVGFQGPVGPGEARALKGVFTELGMADLVRRGFFYVARNVKRAPQKWLVRNAVRQGLPAPTGTRVNAEVLTYCYVFKSPLETVPFIKFLKLARYYRDDKNGLRDAVKAVLANPDAHKEVETIDTLDILATLTGVNG